MYKLLLLIAALMPMCLAQIGTACPGHPPPNSVVVDHCDNAPCDITNGGTYSFTMDFTIGSASTALTHVARAYVNGIDIGYELPPDARDGCATPGITCPVAAGTNFVVPMSITIEAPVTDVIAEIQYELINQLGIIVTCWQSTVNVLP